jgi:hypothetical protein
MLGAIVGAALGLVIVLLASCGPKPPPATPVVITESADCLAGLEAPTDADLTAVPCVSDELRRLLATNGDGSAILAELQPLALCFAFREAVGLGHKLLELYRYRDQVEGRCRPRSDEPGTTTTDTGDDR